MPSVILSGRHRPHEVMLLAVSLLLGIAYLAGAKPPSSVEALMPGWMRLAWYALLAAGGAVGLAATTLHHPYQSLGLERAAMWGQTSSWSIYAIALASYGRAAGLGAACLCAGLAAASAWRIVQISRDMRKLRQLTTEDGGR